MDLRMDYDQFLKLKNQLYSDVYSSQFEQMRADARYYNLDYGHDFQLPEHVKLLIPPTARTAINIAKDHIILDAPRVWVPLRTGQKKATTYQDMKEQMTAFFQTHITQAASMTRQNPYDKARKFIFLRGKAALFTVPDPEKFNIEIPEGISYGPANWPFRVESLDPLTFMEDPDHDPPRYFMRARRVSTRELLENDGDRFDISEDNREHLYGQEPTHYTTIWEYWTPDSIQWFSEELSTCIWDYKHNWGRIPLRIAYSGEGIEEEDWVQREGGRAGNPGGAFPRENLATGLLTYLRKGGMFDQEALTATQLAHLMTTAAWTNYLVSDKVGDQFEPGGGQILEVDLAEGDDLRKHVAAIQGSPPPPHFMQYLDYVTGKSFDAVAPRSVQGIREPGVVAGVHQAQLVQQARLRYGPALESMEKMVSEACQDAAFFHENVLKRPLDVYTGFPQSRVDTVIRPNVWEGDYRVTVKFQTSDTAERDARIPLGERLIQQYGMDPVAIAESHGGVDNPQEQRLKATVWKLLDTQVSNPESALQQTINQAWMMRKEQIDIELGLTPEPGLITPGQGAPGPQAEPQSEMFSQMNQTMGMGPNQAMPGSAPDQNMQMRQMMQQAAGGGPVGDDLPQMAPGGQGGY